MIIDCHGHYTTAPAALQQYRDRQLARLIDPWLPSIASPAISDDQIRETIENNQLRVQNERGIDHVLFSPLAGGMSHHCGTEETSLEWTRICNDLIHRVVALFPTRFSGVCQLPQSPGVPPGNCVAELKRCINELGFVACNINPDPSDGNWSCSPLTDRSWYPLYECMVELNVPAMIHTSCSCNRNFHGVGAHYLNGDTTAFMQLLDSDVFRDFPDLRVVIPHGGGAVPYHWGRYRGLAYDLRRTTLDEQLLKNVYFDTCVYHQAGINLLTSVIPTDNILFATEMIGAVKSVDPETGRMFDDTGPMIEATDLSKSDREKIFFRNALHVYPRLAERLERVGLLKK